MRYWVWGELSELSSWAILLAVMSQQFVDDSLQRIIIIKSCVAGQTKFNIWLLFVIKIPPKQQFLWPRIK